MIAVLLFLPILGLKYAYLDEKILSIDDYISDEQWYVSAAINMYRSIFGADLLSKYNATHYQYTVIINTNCTRHEAVEELREEGLRLDIIEKRHYTKIDAFNIVVGEPFPRKLVEKLICVKDVMPGIAPNEANINAYLNLEHPPLVKYIVGFSMYVIGVNSYAWRMPSLIAGYALIFLALYLIVVYILAKGSATKEKAAMLVFAYTVVVVAVLYDRLFYSLTSITLLDVYTAMFTLLALTLSFHRKNLAAAIAIGLAGSSKMTGFFAIPWLYLSSRIDERKPSTAVIYAVLVPLLVYILVNAPLIAYYGPSKWISELYGALKWHTTSRPPGPPSTDPLGLIVTSNPFPLYYVGGLVFLTARCDPAICIIGLATSLLALVLIVDTCALYNCPTSSPRIVKHSSLVLSLWLGYWLVYLAGNHTLYTFYSIHFYPLLLVFTAILPAYYYELLVRPVTLVQRLITRVHSVVNWCGERYIEARKAIEIARLDPVTKNTAILVTSLLLLSFYIVANNIIDSSLSILLKPCIHHYGFNPIDSFTCLYLDNFSAITLTAISLIIMLDYVVRVHRGDLSFLFALILSLPLIVFSYTKSLGNMFVPLYLLYLYRREESYAYGFLMGIIAPSPIYALIAISSPRTFTGIIAGFIASQAFIYAQEGIDPFQQLVYQSFYWAVVLIVLLLSRLLKANNEKYLPIYTLLAAILSLPCGSLLILYVVHYLASKGKIFSALSLSSIVLALFVLYPVFPPLPYIQSSYYVAISVLAVLSVLGVKHVVSVQLSKVSRESSQTGE